MSMPHGLGDGELVVLVVKVTRVRVALHHHLRNVGQVALPAQVLRFCLLLGPHPGGLQFRVQRGGGTVGHVVQRDVHMVGGVEPTAPEPVQVHGAGVLHAAEEVGRCGVLELPALAVGLEGVVEELAAHHRFAQDVQCRAGLPIGVVAELVDALGVGHDGRDPALVALHVVHDVPGLAAPAGVVAVPFLLGEVLHEGVQALVHPGPLALVRVDDHGEEVVPHLVDDHADHAVLGPLAVGAVGLGPSSIEADHGVLHADAVGVHADGHRVGIVHRELAVGLDGVRHHLGAVALPQRIAFLRIEAHAQDVLVAHGLVLRVPDELAAAGEGEVTHVVGLEHPGLLLVGALLLVLQGLLRGHDHHGFVRPRGPVEAGALLGGEHTVGVLQHPGGGHDVVGRSGDGHLEVAEGERELAAAQELLVLPALVVGVQGHARVELGDGVEVVVLVREVLVPAAPAILVPVVHRIPPGDLELDRLARHQGAGQVDAQHGLVDGVGKRLAAEVGDRGDPEAAVEHVEHALQPLDGEAVAQRARADLVGVAVLRPHVLVQLQPEVVQPVGAQVVVGDGLGPGHGLLRVVQFHLDVVVGFLLPVLVTGGAARRAVGVRRGQLLVQLAELVAAVAGGVLGHQGTGGDQNGQRKQGVRSKHGRENTGLRVRGWRLEVGDWGLGIQPSAFSP